MNFPIAVVRDPGLRAVPDPGKPRFIAPGRVKSVRVRIWNLPHQYLCSIVGTCLTTVEARQLAVRISGAAYRQARDLEVHEQIVRLAHFGDVGGKALSDHLERKFAGPVKRWASLAEPPALIEQWRRAVDSGDIPGAYWALMTHAACDDATRQRAFGDVHMLSHLIGAANRADIRRLRDLDDALNDMKDKVERQQQRLSQAAHEREALLRQIDVLSVAAAARSDGPAQAPATSDASWAARCGRLAEQLAKERSRNEALEQRLQRARQDAERMRVDRDWQVLQSRSLEIELAALRHRAHAAPSQAPAVADESFALLQPLAGKTLLYIGGHEGQLDRTREALRAFGGEVLHHDGGVEERSGLLPGLIGRADLVAVSVDRIGHPAMHEAKRLCKGQSKPFLALRNAGLASLLGAMSRLAAFDPTGTLP